MRKILFFVAIAFVFCLLSGISFAQEVTQPFGGKLKVQGYAEYINYNNDIDADAWGGGILARYLFLDWLGAQTNVTFYGDADSEKLGGDLSATNWRISLILHSYLSNLSPDLPEKLYVYGGGGLGVQFNDNVGSVAVDDAFTGHVLAGIGYDLTELLNIEAEVGYQFGSADVDNYTDSEIGLEAVFVRLGGGIRF